MEEKSIHILAVEDEEFQRLIIADIITILGYKVTTVNSGHEAWDILNEKGSEFDLALLDLVMPGMDGLELLAKMKDSPSLREKPVVMVSAHNNEEKIKASINLGALEFFLKPIRPGAIQRVVDQLHSILPSDI